MELCCEQKKHKISCMRWNYENLSRRQQSLKFQIDLHFYSFTCYINFFIC